MSKADSRIELTKNHPREASESVVSDEKTYTKSGTKALEQQEGQKPGLLKRIFNVVTWPVRTATNIVTYPFRKHPVLTTIAAVGAGLFFGWPYLKDLINGFLGRKAREFDFARNNNRQVFGTLGGAPTSTPYLGEGGAGGIGAGSGLGGGRGSLD